MGTNKVDKLRRLAKVGSLCKPIPLIILFMPTYLYNVYKRKCLEWLFNAQPMLQSWKNALNEK